MKLGLVLKIAAAGLAAVLLTPLGVRGAVYWRSESYLHAVKIDPTGFDPALSADPALLAHGRHVARTRGCFGCHGQNLEGADFDEQWHWPQRAVAPNLAAFIKTSDPAAFEAAVRQGVGANGAALVSMPSYNFARLSNEDLGALYAFLRSAPVVKAELPAPALGHAARRDLAHGAEIHMAAWADLVPELRVDPSAEPVRARGEYLAMTMCNECHGLDVRGQTFYMPPTPDLAMVAALGRDEFERIITTGIGAGDRPLGLMRLVAPDRFPDLQDDEIDALYAYLASLAQEPVPDDVFWRPERGE